MTVQYFTNIAKYNQWANQKLIAWMFGVSDDQWKQPIVSSFPTIGDTVLHIVGAEKVWYDRLIKIENPEWLPFTFKGGKDETLTAWQNSSQLLINFVNELNDSDMTKIIPYKRINGESFTQPVFEILSHVFNHSTYHRGQLITLLRQVGYTDISSTDLLLYYREQT